MKKIIIFSIILISLIVGYLLGNFFPIFIFNSDTTNPPFSLSIDKEQGIQGEARLEVFLVMDNGRLLDNVEVDLAEQPGSPPIGGVALSDDNGIAVFNVKPGNYFIFFNANNFPKNIEYPEPRAIEVLEGKTNQETITLYIK
jgi:hypothetical protein